MEDEDTRIRADRIDVKRDVGLTIVFGDGHECFFEAEALRRECPCATCRDLRDRGELVWPGPGKPAVARIEDARLVGAWGISFLWNDGHDTGIFPWKGLREWCDVKPEETDGD